MVLAVVFNYYIACLYLNTNFYLVWIYKILMRSNFYRQVGFSIIVEIVVVKILWIVLIFYYLSH